MPAAYPWQARLPGTSPARATGRWSRIRLLPELLGGKGKDGPGRRSRSGGRDRRRGRQERLVVTTIATIAPRHCGLLKWIGETRARDYVPCTALGGPSLPGAWAGRSFDGTEQSIRGETRYRSA